MFEVLVNWMAKINTDRVGSETIAIRTRYGSKVHLGSAGGSGTHCGVWNRGANRHFQVHSIGSVQSKNLCEKCFPSHVRGANDR